MLYSLEDLNCFPISFKKYYIINIENKSNMEYILSISK